MSYLPVDFRTIGIADDMLEREINDELSDFFPPPSSPPSVLRNSPEVGLLTEDDLDSDIEENDIDEVGDHDILRSPIIQSRIRDCIRHDSELDSPSEYESESEQVDISETDSSFNVNADLLITVEERKLRNACQCLRQFRSTDVVENRINISAMDRETRDVLIMGQLQACGTSKGEVTKEGKDRKRHKFDYQFLNSPVCKECFLFVNNIGDRILKNVRKHLYKEGAVPRVHGNTNRTPKHAVTYDDAQQVVKFITRFADQFGLPQPAAPRGRDDIPPIYLPGKETYKSVHLKYAEACGDENRVLSETTFRRIWHRVVPHVKFMTPRTDVCHKCEQFRDQIQQSRTEEEKLSATEAFSDHIKSAQRERDHYRSVCAAAKEELDGQPRLEGPVTPCSHDLRNVHYTFDYAQSVLLPSHCRQEGALYFLSPLKVNLFGICNDGRTLQHNYVFGESQSIGEDGQQSHSANSVVSMLDDFFSKHSEGEEVCHLNADNCGGQNKNHIMTSYLSWRVANNLHKEINLHFMKPYHARCLVDSLFGLARRAIRRTDCDSMEDIKRTVERATSHNRVVLYGSQEEEWQWRDWKAFLKPVFRAVPSIQAFHHFKFSSEKTGEVVLRKDVDGPETSVCLLKRGKSVPTGLPSRLEPAGTSSARSKYLHDRIRQFVKDPHKDELCPPPLTEE